MIRQSSSVKGARARGVSLIFALIALAALSLAAVGLIRAVGSGAMVVGNLGFKMDATAVADRGTEAAMAWVTARAGTAALDANAAASGYYASSLTALDPTGRSQTASTRALVDWDGDSCAGMGAHTGCVTPSTSVDLGGVSYSYVITRMCKAVGEQGAAGNSCATTLKNSGGEDNNTGSVDSSNPTGLVLGTTQPYYRIVVRAVGGRDVVSFTEAFIHF